MAGTSFGQTWSGRFVTFTGCVVLPYGLAHTAAWIVPARPEAVVGVLSLLAVAGVAMVMILAHVAGRLADDRRVRWMSPLAAGYGVLAVPSALNLQLGWAVRFGQMLVAPMLLAGLCALAGLAAVLAGQRERNVTLVHLGLASTVIAAAHGYDVLATEAGVHDLVFASIRLTGVVLLLAATIAGTHRAILEVDLEQSEQQEELRLAQLDLRQVAERDHEVRNVVAGLAGAATVMGSRGPVGESATLGTAMVAELARLEALLRAPAMAQQPSREPPNKGQHGQGQPSEGQHGQGQHGQGQHGQGQHGQGQHGQGQHGQGQHSQESYPVDRVLCQQVALRRSTGMRIELAAEAGLGVVGSPSLLAQVLTNVLANCAAHAPDSPVLVEALRVGTQVCIRVSDLGPGISVEPGRDVFESGVRGERSEGHGFGLHISRGLLAAEGATITIRPRSVERPGCTVELRLAAAEAEDLSGSRDVAGKLVAQRSAS